MPRLIKAGETTAARLQVYFHLLATDGLSPATEEVGGQPEIMVDGAVWTSTGIGTLKNPGGGTSGTNPKGRYYAELTAATVATAGPFIESRYKSVNTLEIPGLSVQVVGFNPSLAFTGNTGVVVDAASKAGYVLGGTGLDAVIVETNLNARQALAIVAAATAGTLSGAATTSIAIAGAGVATNRLQATVDSDGNRSAVTLNLPA